MQPSLNEYKYIFILYFFFFSFLFFFFFLGEERLNHFIKLNYKNQTKQKKIYMVEQTPSRPLKEKIILLSGLRRVQPHCLT